MFSPGSICSFVTLLPKDEPSELRTEYNGWGKKRAESASKLRRMGITRSGGTGSPATRYLYIMAWCSNSCHCIAVNGAPYPTSPPTPTDMPTATDVDDVPLIFPSS
ncbi:hypothetical protein ACJIZ3_004227 [Penstemon smallii]|uniref:Uncharacterized protein n=1 Tax=Penstemon smallii TaxID=265156 RepID=A0ABD3S1J5_9LAMI